MEEAPRPNVPCAAVRVRGVEQERKPLAHADPGERAVRYVGAIVYDDGVVIDLSVVR